MKWISVKDELPKKEINLYAIHYKSVDKIKPKGFFQGCEATYDTAWGIWCYEEKEIESDGDKVTYAKKWGFKTGYMESNFIKNVTHWMQLPEAPKEK